MTLTSLASNQTLLEHYEAFKNVHMRDLFNEDGNRFSGFSLQAPHVFIDYSKNRISKTTLSLLFKLAEEARLNEQKQCLFTGANFNNERLNNTEKRHALHAVLRRPCVDKTKDLIVDSENLSEAVRLCHKKCKVSSKKYIIMNIWELKASQ